MDVYSRHAQEDDGEDEEEEEMLDYEEREGDCRSNGRLPAPAPAGGFSRPLLPPNSSLVSPPRTTPPANGIGAAAGAGAVRRYRECLKNHGAHIGAHILDGCGEFMPSPASGGDAALACAACGCHRSFHRKEEPASAGAAVAGFIDGSLTGKLVPLLLPPPPPAPAPSAFTVTTGAAADSPPRSSNEMALSPAGMATAGSPVGGTGGKRFRTKFTPEQKAMMKEFSHRVGWRVKKEHEAAVEEFCRQVGVPQRVLKVWMHNNKHLANEHRAAAAGRH